MESLLTLQGPYFQRRRRRSLWKAYSHFWVPTFNVGGEGVYGKPTHTLGALFLTQEEKESMESLLTLQGPYFQRRRRRSLWKAYSHFGCPTFSVGGEGVYGKPTHTLRASSWHRRDLTVLYLYKKPKKKRPIIILGAYCRNGREKLPLVQSLFLAIGGEGLLKACECTFKHRKGKTYSYVLQFGHLNYLLEGEDFA